ncbi:L-fuconate dehydratase [Roseivirga sp. E12]|uniref:L-fuconate dehydratase n=1 Tax=Roseivirga sp. E12 TaxID=2819237 RepID=UPI001ABCAF86|nr:L-fuconate dehydratase [Roseivirga sp. E12]MBO3699897.1 L-fuconate dehydratase [Roseivirga sp. E12]
MFKNGIDSVCTIVSYEVKDIRFPTSKTQDGSDAMNPDPDYSAAYLMLKTNIPGLEGHGLTFTIGRGNEICVQAIRAFMPLVIGKNLTDITTDMGGFWKSLNGDSQLRWLGPEKGVIHISMGAVINAVWDLWAKYEEKPLWKLVADMSPQQLVSCVDFTYITDVITPEKALQNLTELAETKSNRIDNLKHNGYPAYTTSAGWLGYSDDKIRRLCREAVAEGWNHVKMKVGSNLEDDVRRATIIREEIGDERSLMMDANQKWDVNEAIQNMETLRQFNPLWIEEPTSPDDILGHKTIGDTLESVKIATGEHCQNRVMFKQFMTSGAMDICQIDSCRLAGVNEVLAVLMMAHELDIPVCPHAGGVGLCEYVQHLAMIDYICISGTLENRVVEYVDHLHEHFEAPVKIKNAAYSIPMDHGYSITMKEESISTYSYPRGEYWENERIKEYEQV